MSAFAGVISLKENLVLNQRRFEQIRKHISERGSHLNFLNHEKNAYFFETKHYKNKIHSNNLGKFNNFYIIFNGEIDNKNELISLLQLNINESYQDIEIVYGLYNRFGKDFVKKIFGSFAIIIFDSQKKRVICARDHLGIKPFYYYFSNGVFAFSSDANLIFKIIGIKPSINFSKIAQIIARNEICHHKTTLDSINKIVRGNILFVDSYKADQESYHCFKKENDLKLDEIEYLELFKNTLFDSVINKIPDNERIGSTLSGGLDSSAITKILEETNQHHGLNKKIFTYSLNFVDLKERDLSNTNEMNYVYDFHSNSTSNHRVLDIKYYDVVSDLLNSQGRFSEPCTHSNRFIETALIKGCKDDNVSCLFTGFDGDTTVGYGKEIVQKYFQSFRLHDALRSYGSAQRISGKKPQYAKVFLRYFLSLFLPWQIHYLVKAIKGTDSISPHIKFLGKEIKESINLMEVVKNNRKLSFEYKKGHERLLNNNTYSKVFEMLDVDYSISGITEKHPFCDVRLMELSLSYPLEQKFRNGVTRYILRESMKNKLPDSIYKRTTKSNLSPYFFYSVDSNLKMLLEKIIDTQSPLKDYIDLELLKSFYKDGNKMSLEDKSYLVYLNTIESWIEQIAD